MIAVSRGVPLALIALALAGCSGKPADSGTTSTAGSGEPATTAAPAGEATATVAAVDPASGDADKGKLVFNRCVACHTTEKGGANGVGPNLHGVVGHKPGSVAGYAYSPAMAGLGGTWDPATLDTYLTNPHKMLPGTKMAFAGIPDAGDRANLIAFLAAQKD